MSLNHHHLRLWEALFDVSLLARATNHETRVHIVNHGKSWKGAFHLTITAHNKRSRWENLCIFTTVANFVSLSAEASSAWSQTESTIATCKETTHDTRSHESEYQEERPNACVPTSIIPNHTILEDTRSHKNVWIGTGGESLARHFRFTQSDHIRVDIGRTRPNNAPIGRNGLIHTSNDRRCILARLTPLGNTLQLFTCRTITTARGIFSGMEGQLGNVPLENTIRLGIQLSHQRYNEEEAHKGLPHGSMHC